MTNQKTIERLKAVRNYLCTGNPIWDVNEMRDVFDMAISALQAQEAKAQLSAEGTTSDLISRQAAIDRINKQREHLQPDIYPQDKIGDAAYRICAEFIERLPSAQPEIEERTEEFAQNVPKEDLISRKAAIDAMGKAQWAKERLMELPSAQPERTEIIRCKDCNKASKCYGDVIMRSRGGGNIYCPLEFCSEAERRTDDLQ